MSKLENKVKILPTAQNYCGPTNIYIYLGITAKSGCFHLDLASDKIFKVGYFDWPNAAK